MDKVNKVLFDVNSQCCNIMNDLINEKTMEKIDIAELLKDCPEGMELDCTMFDNVEFINVEEDDKPICIKTGDIYRYLTKFGTWTFDENAKCVIFPKGKTTWEGFVPPYKLKDGDIVYIKTKGHNHNEYIIIFKEIKNEHIHKHVCLAYQVIFTKPNAVCHLVDIEEVRLATEEEKAKLFQAIKENGYKWNAESKTLEELPKFKVGDTIIPKDSQNKSRVINAILDNEYNLFGGGKITFSDQDNWELVTNKFDITALKPFDKVLVRDTCRQIWIADLFSHDVKEPFGGYRFACIGHHWHQCIPYESNEHLLGTINDCSDYFKTWK